jgi:hypothetical protein
VNAADFRLAMAALPEPPADSLPPHWNHWRHRLWELSQTDDVSNFMSWQPIFATMLVDHFPIGTALTYLQEDWPRWEPIVSHLGDERHYRNMVNQCVHIRLFEQTTGTRISDYELIAEFGGGYGAMAQACYGAGFRGVYVIHDLPEFRLLQQWYLSQHTYDGLTLIWSDLPHVADLLIGIYSLSEIPPSERGQWLISDRYLLLCSSRFDKWDNLQFMRKLIESRPDMNWHEQQKEQRPDFYLIGWPK